jgi:hypothetical protein
VQSEIGNREAGAIIWQAAPGDLPRPAATVREHGGWPQIFNREIHEPHESFSLEAG